MSKRLLSAVDIGGTKITVSIVRAEGILIKLYQNVRLEGENSTIPRQVTQLINEALERIGAQTGDIYSVGISTASPFIIKKGFKVLVSPNLCGGLAGDRDVISNDWTEIPLEEILKKRFENVTIGNDCVTAVKAEHLFGAGRNYDDVIYITWSTGIGAGIISGGRILDGKNSNAGHAGHMFISQDGPRCGCGNIGDVESLSSGTAIAREYGAKSAEVVFKAFREGDKKAVTVVKNAIYNFSRGLASINALLDTKVIILGGGVYLNNHDILLPAIKKEFYSSFPALSEEVIFKNSDLHSFLGDIAALSLVMPDEWIKKWREGRYWETAPSMIVINDK